MPYKRVIKVSDEVYAELRKIMNEYGFPSPNQAIVFLINEYKSTDRRVTLSSEDVLDVKVDGVTPYYVRCDVCGHVAHFVRGWASKNGKWYYCPKCDRVFKVE